MINYNETVSVLIIELCNYNNKVERELYTYTVHQLWVFQQGGCCPRAFLPRDAYA